MKRPIFLALLVLTFLAACEDSKGAGRQLETLGYTDIVIKGHGGGWKECASGTLTRTLFAATDPSGKHRVRGAVCDGSVHVSEEIPLEYSRLEIFNGFY